MFQTKEEIRQYNLKYRSEHKQEILDYAKRYRQENKENVLEYNRKYRDEHKVEAKAREIQYNIKNRVTVRERRRLYNQKNKDKIKNFQSNSPENRMRIYRKYAYGLTHEQFLEKLKLQDGKCSICRQLFYEQRGTPCVDHNHETDKVRDLLCQNCNRALGLFKENPTVLENAIQYLKKHKEENNETAL